LTTEKGACAFAANGKGLQARIKLSGISSTAAGGLYQHVAHFLKAFAAGLQGSQFSLLVAARDPLALIEGTRWGAITPP
jgi:hypothetical protein